MTIYAIDHVQLAMPAGGEDAARGFFAGLLGLVELPKPVELAGRGGCWFGAPGVQIHLGVEADFRPARKAHPALLVHALPVLVERLRHAGVAVRDDDQIPGRFRVFVDDPFGNRIELIEVGDGTSTPADTAPR